MPAGLAASNPKYTIKVRGNKLVAEKPAFVFLVM